MKTENLSTLQLNLLSNEQFKNALNNEKIDPNAFYLTPEENLFIRYAYDAEPIELFDTWAEGMSYIGFAYAEEAPTSYADYSWSLFIGSDGKDGQPGQSVHIRYSEYEDGTEFTDTWSAGHSYIGFAVATEAPTNKDEYTWSMFVSNIRYTQTVILEVDKWVDNKQTVQITGIADNTTVTATPSPASQESYLDAGIYLQEASVGHATFACHHSPTADVTINVVILDPVGSVGGSEISGGGELPESTAGDQGKVLTVDEQGSAEWTNLSDHTLVKGMVEAIADNHTDITNTVNHIEELKDGGIGYSLGTNDVIEWDMQTPDIVIGGNDGSHYYISDRVLTVDELIGAKVCTNLNTYTIDESRIFHQTNAILIGTANDREYADIIVTTEDNVTVVAPHFGESDTDWYSRTFPKAGTYFWNFVFRYVRRLIIQEEDIHSIDTKYLPEGVGYERVTELGNTLEWDGTPSDVVISVEVPDGETTAHIQYHRVSDTPIQLADIIGSEIITTFQTDPIIVTNNMVDGTEGYFYGVFVNDSPIIAVSFVENFTISFNNTPVTIPKQGVYFSFGYGSALVSSITTPNHVFSTTDIHKIDHKYIAFSNNKTIFDGIVDVEWSDDFGGPVAEPMLSESIQSGQEYIVQIGEEIYTRRAYTVVEEGLPITVIGSDYIFTGVSNGDPFFILSIAGYCLIGAGAFWNTNSVKITTADYANIPTECVEGALPKVTLTTPIATSLKPIALTEAESAALSNVAESGKPIIVEGVLNGDVACIVAYNVGKHTLMADVLNVATVLLELDSDTRLWTMQWQIDDTHDDLRLLESTLTQRIDVLENFVEGMKTMAENPANEGKYFGVKDEKVDIVDPLLPTITAADNGKFLQVVDGAIALVTLKTYNGEVR